MQICLSFLNTAAGTWALLEQARSAGVQIGEESVTDFLMIRLRETLPSTCIVRPFNRFEEGKNGADWELWLVDRRSTCLGFRFQAKVIHFSDESFPSLHYYRNRRNPTRREYQCDALIQHASSHRPPALPIYCLYCHGLGPTWQQRHPQGMPAFLWGCSVLPAHVVQSLPRIVATTRIGYLRRFVRPWHELVCGAGMANVVRDVADRWNQNMRSIGASDESMAGLDIAVPVAEPSERIPEYVAAVLEERETLAPDDELRYLVLVHVS